MKATLIGTLKNEGPYLVEWVAHHRAMGFDTIIVYENSSDDASRRLLRYLHEIGAIQFFRNENPPRNYQIRAYTRAGEEAAFRQADWAMALDLDEFLVVKTGGGTVQDYVNAVPDCDAILTNWRLYGSGGHGAPDGSLVTERFVRAEPAEEIMHDIKAVKTLFRPAVFERPGIHLPRLPQGSRAEPRYVNGSGLAEGQYKRLNYRANDPKMLELAQVNHYAVRDAASFLIKTYRGSAHQEGRKLGTRYWNTKNRNEVPDDCAHTHLQRTRAQIAAMDAEAGGKLSELTDLAVQLHLAKLEELLADPEARSRYMFYLGKR